MDKWPFNVFETMSLLTENISRCQLCSISGEDLTENEKIREGIQEVCENISQICKRFSPRLGGKKGCHLRVWRILFHLANRRLELMKTIEEEMIFKVLTFSNMSIIRTPRGERQQREVINYKTISFPRCLWPLLMRTAWPMQRSCTRRCPA